MELKPEYRFKCEIVDAETDMVVASASIFIIPESVTFEGACESVDMEVAALLRAFRSKARAEFEAVHYSTDDAA